MQKHWEKGDAIDAKIAKSQKGSFLDMDEDDINTVNHTEQKGKLTLQDNKMNHKLNSKVSAYIANDNSSIAGGGASSVGGSLVGARGSVANHSVSVATSKVSFSGDKKVSISNEKKVAWN
jgi:hypothetical protein